MTLTKCGKSLLRVPQTQWHFIGTHDDEPLSVAMCVHNPDCSTATAIPSEKGEVAHLNRLKIWVQR
jgi:hypothetical protein